MENGLQLFSAGRQHKFHPGSYLLFSDVVMPGNINGYELAEQAREKNSKLKVLIASGFADKFAGNEKYAKYGFELIPKPYDRGQLAEKLHQLLDA